MDATDTSIEILAPKMSRLSTSRPNSSLPSGWAALGGASERSGFGSSGSYGAMSGATTATTTKRARIPPPIRMRRFRRRRPPDLVSPILDLLLPRLACAVLCSVAISGPTVPDARVEIRIEQVDEQVDQHECQRDDQHDTLHHRVVAAVRGRDQQGAHSWPGEDVLDDHGSAQQGADLHAGQRH